MKTFVRDVWSEKSALFVAACLLVIHLYLFSPHNTTPLYAQDVGMDIFVHIDGAKGSSTDEAHLGWIEATGVKFSITGSELPVGGGSRTPAILNAVTIVKEIDISSPILTIFCAEGKFVKYATVHFVENSQDRRVFYEIFMIEVVLSSVSVDSNSSEVSLKEAYKLRANRVEWTVTPVKPDGSPGAAIKRCWDFKHNTRCY